MKIAVSSTGTDLSANVDERFGRCRYFLFVETDDMAFEAIDNTNADLTSSAGIQSAGIVADAGAKVVITGNCGPKAMQVFDAANVRVILGQRGVIRDVVEKFKKGELDASIGGNLQQPVGAGSVGASPMSWGSGRGGGRGMGGGRGRGGCGGGMGMGRRCMATDGGTQPVQPRGAGNPANQQRQQLQQQADALKQQLAEIENKIRDLT
ncbi:hypothetical protein JCM12296A_47960 [Desulfosarcina cetonica]